ncbi:BQ5605_C009g05591 [Microbotryum silenes-dioicae]|uniref:BQ5605_C009g05591 protein n=1 Tax=Microbotryum silenes-dioicae TaxID=796604 RepID=A0A2X0MHQ4_9BASI|nr:BQ5605_C009g05591 [Microbotryum silenes-dioicae]
MNGSDPGSIPSPAVLLILLIISESLLIPTTSTIALYIHEVVEAIITSKLYGIYVHRLRPDEPTSKIITRNPKLKPYFGQCIGALDGIHVLWKAR